MEIPAKDKEILDKIAKFYTNPDRIKIIGRIFGNIMNVPPKILAQIWDNWDLFSDAAMSTRRILVHPDLAIGSKNPGDIVVYFSHILVYAIMSVAEYNQFNSEVCFNTYKDEIYQIILCSEQQKVILVCDRDQEFIDRLVAHTSKNTKYELHIRNDKNQIEIKNKVAKNYEESRQIFDDLADSLAGQYENIEDILQMIKPKRSLCRNIELPISDNFGVDVRGITDGKFGNHHCDQPKYQQLQHHRRYKYQSWTNQYKKIRDRKMGPGKSTDRFHIASRILPKLQKCDDHMRTN